MRCSGAHHFPVVGASSTAQRTNFGSRHKLYHKYMIRGGERYDPPHRTVKARERALNGAKGGWIKAEFGIVCRLYSRSLRVSGESLTDQRRKSRTVRKLRPHTFPLYKNFAYEHICHARYDKRVPASFGSEEHQMFI